MLRFLLPELPLPPQPRQQAVCVRQLLGTPELYAKNHVYVLERLRQMGYSAVELASYEAGRFSGMEPAAFAGTIKDAGLKISSSHTTRVLSPQEMETADFGKALEWWDECIAGTRSYVVEMEYSSSPNVLQGLMDCAQYIRNASFVKETYR